MARERRGYQDLIGWQKAMDLAEAVYLASRSWPVEERFGLTNQVRRSAASVPANIAEGEGRDAPREFAHFLSIARGSLAETETHIILAYRVGYLDDATHDNLLERAIEVGRILRGLHRKLRETEL